MPSLQLRVAIFTLLLHVYVQLAHKLVCCMYTLGQVEIFGPRSKAVTTCDERNSLLNNNKKLSHDVFTIVDNCTFLQIYLSILTPISRLMDNAAYQHPTC